MQRKWGAIVGFGVCLSAIIVGGCGSPTRERPSATRLLVEPENTPVAAEPEGVPVVEGLVHAPRTMARVARLRARLEGKAAP